jgi:hypothetical protein
MALRRKAGLCDGIYIRGSIQGIPTVLTANTGASRTVLSIRFFNKIEYKNRPPLEKSNMFNGAGEAPLKESGNGFYCYRWDH